MKKIELLGLQTIPEIKAGDNLAQIICDCAKKENVGINEKDILVLTSKIISKALGLMRKKSEVKVSEKALRISQKTGKDPIWVQMIFDAGHEVVAVIPLGGVVTDYIVYATGNSQTSQTLCDNEKCIFITKSPTGRIHTCDAGIDGSNHPDGIVSLFPDNPDAEAAKIRKAIQEITGKKIAIVLADTELVPYGTIDLAVGSAGIDPFPMVFGQKDKFGKPKFGGADLVGHELTAASALLFGQTNAGIPVTIIRGYDYQFDETKNVSSAPHYSGNKKEFYQIVRGTLKATSYAVNGLGKKLLLRIGSWFAR
ncbi:MAG: coenzyme F420-0:L-glutamate ligase [Sedimentisphaerales bacterium]|jgi:coenzyme F420-0:L-glutamate ligase/coenzyme F420-1:gamma-L-glutamate ligase